MENGRDGAGTVFVFSAGNSRSEGDNVNYHNFQNARETITVAATELDGSVASFSTPGAAILVGAYGVDLLTTDRLVDWDTAQSTAQTQIIHTSPVLLPQPPWCLASLP